LTERKKMKSLKAGTISVLIIASSIPVAFIPLIGVVLSITLVPYLSSAIGLRLAHREDRIPLALGNAIVWSALESALIIGLFSAIETPMGFVMGSSEYMVLFVIWSFNLLFCIMGAIRPWWDPEKDPIAV